MPERIVTGGLSDVNRGHRTAFSIRERLHSLIQTNKSSHELHGDIDEGRWCPEGAPTGFADDAHALRQETITRAVCSGSMRAWEIGLVGLTLPNQIGQQRLHCGPGSVDPRAPPRGRRCASSTALPTTRQPRRPSVPARIRHRSTSTSCSRSRPVSRCRRRGDLFVAQRAIAVEGGEEHRALVAEGLVDAAGGQPHRIDQVADRGGMVAVFAKHPDRLVERLVQIEFARPAAAARRTGSRLSCVVHGTI